VQLVGGGCEIANIHAVFWGFFRENGGRLRVRDASFGCANRSSIRMNAVCLWGRVSRLRMVHGQTLTAIWPLSLQSSFFIILFPVNFELA
jgi:hypothetical protein